MEIKRPIIPTQVENLHLNQTTETKQETAANAAKLLLTSDTLESAKTNAFTDVLHQADQNEGSNGEKQLNQEQQQFVSKFNYNDLLKDTRPFVDDGKSSDQTQDPKSQFHFPGAADNVGQNIHLTDEDKQRLKDALNPVGSDQIPAAVKDAERLISDGLLNAFNEDVSDAHSDLNSLLGYDINSRFKHLVEESDPNSNQADNSNPVYGKSMLEDNLGGDVTPEEIDAAKKKYAKEHPDPVPAGTTPPKPADSTPPPDNSVKPPSLIDIVVNTFLNYATKESPLPTPPTPPDPETGKNMLDGFRAIFGSKSRTPESEAGKGGGKLNIPDPDNYQGNIPADLKRVEEFFKSQMAKMKPPTGGETVHTVDDVGTKVSGPVSSLIVKQGEIGLVGQPNQLADGAQKGPLPERDPNSGVSGFGKGGNIDYESGAGKTGWAGGTHDQDPGSIKFGNDGPLAGTPNSQNSQSSDNTIDLTRLRQILAELRETRPEAFYSFLEHLKNSQ